MALTLSRKSPKKSVATSARSPLVNRELQARMKLAGVNARQVSRALRIAYARCTEVITGTRIHAANFERIRKHVFALPIH